MASYDDQYFRQLCDHLGFVCIATDRDLRVAFANRYAASQFAKPAGELAGQSVLDILPVEDRGAARLLFEDIIARKTAGEMEVKYPAEDGSKRTFVLIASPILDDARTCLGATACMRDISQRKRLAQELARARRMTSLGNVAAGVAHHFNNILGGMMAVIDRALKSESVRDIREALRLVADGIGRARRITDQLAAFAVSENAVPESAELNPILMRFIERLRRRAAPANIEIVAEVDEIASRPFETTRLMPVLESLAENAFDAMPAGGKLSIEMTRQGDHARISLTDTGTGMSDEVQERLFEPFFTTKGGAGGGQANIGLGLAAVHGLVTEMGGTIQITSRLGKGTEVTLRLPLKGQDAGADSSVS